MTQPMLQDLLANSGLAHAQLLRAMFDSPEDAIIAKTLDGIVQTWNKGAAEMYGFSSEEVVGQPVSMLCPPDRKGEVTGFIERISRGERVMHYETVRRRKDGEISPPRCRSRPSVMLWQADRRVVYRQGHLGAGRAPGGIRAAAAAEGRRSGQRAAMIARSAQSSLGLGVLPPPQRDLLAQHQQLGSFDAAERASSAIHAASRTNIRYSIRTVTSPRSCQPSGHHGWHTRRSATYAPFWNPTRSCGE